VEELSDTQARELCQDLGALRRELEGALAAAREGAKPVAVDLPIGRVSRMDAMQQQQMARAGLAALELRLQQVAAALALCAAGEYGDCRKCGEPIGYRRLKARPETPFCVVCQSGSEQSRS